MPFRNGEAYQIRCTYINPPKNKYAICVCAEKPLLFFINTEPRSHFHIDTQILVTPKDFHFLKHNSYINTGDIVTCIVPTTCWLLNEYGEIPQGIKEKIIGCVQKSTTLAGRHIEWIIESLR